MTAADPTTLRHTRSVAETEALGAALADALSAGDVVVLHGPLGAGKTRLVAGLARGLHAASRVRSPTFALVHEYGGRVPLVHVDLYRVESRDVAGLGLEDYLERAALVVEWGDRLPESWRRDALELELRPQPDGTRTIEARAAGERGAALLQAWRRLDREGRG